MDFIASWYRSRRREQGLLLIEVMITLLTIVLALLALGRIQVEIVTDTATARHRERALNLALDRIEDMRFSALSDPGKVVLAVSGSERLGPPGSGTEHERPGLERIYDIRWQVRPLGLWRDGLQVEVRWREPGAGELSIWIETRLCLIPRYVPYPAGAHASLGRLYRARIKD